MITIGIDPVIFNIGGFELRWYQVIVVLAIIAVTLIATREARKVGIPKEVIYSLALWAIIGGIIGSRLLHVIDQWEYYSAYPRYIIGFEGQTIYGAVLGAIVATLIYCLVNKVSFWKLADIIAPGAILGQAIGRVGCIIDGCCYGKTTNFVLAVTYTHPDSYALLGVPTHFTMGYQLLWNLFVFAVLWKLRKRLKPDGSLFLLYLALYSIGDFVIRFFREGSPFLLGLYQAQVVGLVVLAVTIPWLVIKLRQGKALESLSGEAKPKGQNQEV